MKLRIQTLGAGEVVKRVSSLAITAQTSADNTRRSFIELI